MLHYTTGSSASVLVRSGLLLGAMFLLGACNPAAEQIANLEAQVAKLETVQAEQIAKRDREIAALMARIDTLEEQQETTEARGPARQIEDVPEGSVTQVSPLHYQLKRGVIDLQNPESISGLLRFLPHRNADGQPDGYRLSAIRRNSLPYGLGFKNGDLIHAVNDAPITTQEEALTAAREPSPWVFKLTRRGEVLALKIELVD